jgi:hypothetical protein
MNNLLDVKENYEHALDFALHFRLGRVLLWLRVIIVNPTLITSYKHGQEGCIIERDLMRFFADVDMVPILISC